MFVLVVLPIVGRAPFSRDGLHAFLFILEPRSVVWCGGRSSEVPFTGLPVVGGLRSV